MSVDNLLVEIGTEELPPKALRSLMDAFGEGLKTAIDEARLELAHFTAWNADYAESQALYAELLARRPDDRLLRTELAEVTSWRGQYGPARRQLEALIDEQPDDLRARVGLGNVHAWSGAHRLADATYREVLAQDPGHETARRQLDALERWIATRAPAPALSLL